MILKGHIPGTSSDDDEIQRKFKKKLVVHGHIVALYTDDPDACYYLLNVPIASRKVSSSWGTTINKGSEIQAGYYLVTALSNKLLSKRYGVVLAA